MKTEGQDSTPATPTPTPGWTPGPWRLAHTLPSYFSIFGPTKKTGYEGTITPCIATIPISRSTDNTAQANATLIAAAPALVEALIAAVETLDACAEVLSTHPEDKEHDYSGSACDFAAHLRETLQQAGAL